MKKFTALLLATLCIAFCIVPSFAASTPSVTASTSFQIVPLEIQIDQVIWARILNSANKVLEVITDPADITLTTVDGAPSEQLKKAYEELDSSTSLIDLCPNLSSRYKTVFGFKKYYYNSLVVVKLFEITLSAPYAKLLNEEGNKIEFAVTRVLKPTNRIVGIFRKEEIKEDGTKVVTWDTVTKEVNTAEKVLITNTEVGPFALVVRKDTPSDGGSLWNRLVELWLDILG